MVADKMLGGSPGYSLGRLKVRRSWAVADFAACCRSLHHNVAASSCCLMDLGVGSPRHIAVLGDHGDIAGTPDHSFHSRTGHARDLVRCCMKVVDGSAEASGHIPVVLEMHIGHIAEAAVHIVEVVDHRKVVAAGNSLDLRSDCSRSCCLRPKALVVDIGSCSR